MIDLKVEYGNKYRVTLEESWGPGEDRPKAEFMEVRGKHGYIRPWGDDELELYVENVRIAARIERVYPQFKPKNHYDDGAAFVFKPELLGLAVKLIKARKRRQLTEEAKAANAARLAKYRITKKNPIKLSLLDDKPLQ